jgi:hypothetical protein
MRTEAIQADGSVLLADGGPDRPDMIALDEQLAAARDFAICLKRMGFRYRVTMMVAALESTLGGGISGENPTRKLTLELDYPPPEQDRPGPLPITRCGIYAKDGLGRCKLPLGHGGEHRDGSLLWGGDYPRPGGDYRVEPGPPAIRQ